jgi:beta-glucosidase
VPEKKPFPPGFLWGAATAAHQVEGGNRNDWTAWEELGGSKDLSGRACEHWDLDRFRQDVRLARSLGLNSYRLSIEWSRVMPDADRVDAAALAHYREMLGILKAEGMTVMATLHHFTNPTWFVRMGGWERASCAPFIRYVREAVTALDDLVDLWATINEPVGYALLGWVFGWWPPGRKRSLLGFFRVARRLAKAHNNAYRAIKNVSRKPVGIVHSMIAYEPYSQWFPDRLIAWALNYVGNQWFLRKTRNDFIGLNYYMRQRFRIRRLLMPQVEEVKPDGEVSDFGWEIYPKGIYDLLMSLRRYRVPVYVTENGIADAADAKRPEFIRSHLRWVRRAIDGGTPVKGYFHWSLLDNFEWAEGYSKRFGLIEVDFATQERRLRASALAYRDIAAANAIDD